MGVHYYLCLQRVEGKVVISNEKVQPPSASKLLEQLLVIVYCQMAR